MEKAIEQDVLVVETNAYDERDVSKSIQENITKAIKQLNAEGKRVINISSGPDIKVIFGVKHITYILWEEVSFLTKDYYRVEEGNQSTKAQNSIMTACDERIEMNRENAVHSCCRYYKEKNKICGNPGSDCYYAPCKNPKECKYYSVEE